MARNRSENLPGRLAMLKYASAIERWLEDTSSNIGDSWQQIPVPVQNEMDRRCAPTGTEVDYRRKRLAYIRETYGT